MSMSLTERAASERLIQAMGPMVQDENKIQKVILFIQSLREEDTTLPVMSFAELEDCIPLDVAFDKIRNNVKHACEQK